MECTNCGNILDDNALVCDLCGATFETVEFNSVNGATEINPDGQVGIINRSRRRKINPPPMSLLQYVYMLVIMCVPIGGLVMTCMWAFNKKENPNRTNLAKAALIVGGAVVLIFILLSILFGNVIGEFIKNYLASL